MGIGKQINYILSNLDWNKPCDTTNCIVSHILNLLLKLNPIAHIQTII